MIERGFPVRGKGGWLGTLLVVAMVFAARAQDLWRPGPRL